MSKIYLLSVSTVEVKDISHLFSHNLKLKGMVLIALLTKLVITGIYWIIVIRILLPYQIGSRCAVAQPVI